MSQANQSAQASAQNQNGGDASSPSSQPDRFKADMVRKYGLEAFKQGLVIIREY